jgi:Flp pilus assembly pilin Flp
MNPVRNITSSEDGQALPEYALILALIGVALFGALTFLQGQITGLFTQVGSLL